MSETYSWYNAKARFSEVLQKVQRVLSEGYLRGAHLWHLTCALYRAENARELSFLTLDERQRSVAEGLGFPG